MTMPTVAISGFVTNNSTNPTAFSSTGPNYDAPTIDLANGPYDTDGVASFASSTHQLTIKEGGATYVLQLDPNQTHANDVFPLSNDGNGGTVCRSWQNPTPALTAALRRPICHGSGRIRIYRG
jgi:hypothetical protein